MEQTTVPALRKMEVSDVIDAAIRLYRHNFAQLLGTAAVVYVPVMGMQTVAIVQLGSMFQGPAFKGDQIPWVQLATLGLGFVGLLMLSVILTPLGEGAVCLAISELYMGRKIGVWEAYRRVSPSLLRLLWTNFLVGVIVGSVYIVGLVLCVAPGIAGYLWLMTLFLFAWPVVVLEGVWGVPALQRSNDLTKGFFWRICGTWVLLAIVVGIGAQAVALPVQMLCVGVFGESQPLLAQAISQSVTMAVTLLIRPVNITAVVLLYYDARIRKEGFDLMVMAAALGYTQKPTVADAAQSDAVPLFDLAPVPGAAPLPPRPGEEGPQPAAAPTGSAEAFEPQAGADLPPRPTDNSIEETQPYDARGSDSEAPH